MSYRISAFACCRLRRIFPYNRLQPTCTERRYDGRHDSGVLQYTKNFTRPINEIAQQYSSIQTAIAGAERVFEIMDTEPESDEGADKDFSIDNVRGDLMFKDIDFSYVPGEKVLHDFDLWIKSGQKLAIVGATGSGKTTVVNLLTRFYDIDGGSITLDGESIYDIPKRNCVAL